MRHLVTFLLVLLLFGSCRPGVRRGDSVQGNQVACICEKRACDYCVKVVSITDGDTFKGENEKKEVIIFRIYGIDAPETRPKQPYGAESKQFLMDLIDGGTVGIKTQSKDRFGRYVVWVYTSDGKDVSAELLKAGMAWHFKRYDSTAEYAEYETKAKRRGVG